jgi:isopenicillin-N epimerase
MRSLVVSWGEPDGYPSSFESVGTDDLSAWLATPDSLRVLGSLGWDRVRAHNEALVGWAQLRVAEILGIPTSGLRHDPGLSMALVQLPAGRADTREQTQRIQEHMAGLGVEMAIGCWNGRGVIRLSAQVYNQPSDYERLAIGVRDLLAF